MWQRIAVGAIGLLVTIGLLWTESVSGDVDSVKSEAVATKSRVRDLEENNRSLHDGQENIVSALEALTEAINGGSITVPPIRPLYQGRGSKHFTMHGHKEG